MPKLWTTIIFHRGLDEQGFQEQIITRLERASTSPIDICISAGAVHMPAIKNMRKICRLILPLIDRWRSLVIDKNVPHKAVRMLLDRLGTSPAQNLEELVIEPSMFFWWEEKKLKWRFKGLKNGRTFPALRYLKLSRCRFDWNSITFDGVIDLQIQDARLDERDASKITSLVRVIMSRAPHLRRLAVSASFSHRLFTDSARPSPDAVREILHHYALQELRISVCESLVTDALLHSVIMPSLENLNAEPAYNVLPHSFYTLAYINPLRNLDSIRLHGCRDRPTLTPQERDALPIALQSMERLRRLEFRRLNLTESETWLPRLLQWLKALKDLTFDCCQGLRASALQEMIQHGRTNQLDYLQIFGSIELDSIPLDYAERSKGVMAFEKFIESLVRSSVLSLSASNG
ncbi:hypothetical protein FRB90_005278 [Tulasnella sp. 427]|nr:hypothetical protein FRB90_005278 [Tulasnella sp. 427]